MYTLIETEFIKDGKVTSRGEFVSSYKTGDEVTILEEVTSNLVRIVVMSGESKGEVVIVDKEYLQ